MALYIGDTLIAGNIDGQQLNNPFSLLDYKYSEYELSNASWLLSNGQWNSGAVYQSVYNLLLQIYNGTVTKAGVSVKLSTETYADTDFVLNTSDTTFRLPIKVLMAGSKRVAGNGKSIGLTDGNSEFTGGFGTYSGVGLTAITSNSLQTVLPNNAIGGQTGYDISNHAWGITTDETKSGIETSSTGLYLYFYVGETVQDANIIAAAGVLTDVADLKAHSIVETYVNGTSWYRVYSDGWCEQGSISSIGADGSTQTITLLKTMSDVNYNILAIQRDGVSGAYTNGIRIVNYTTTSFQINNRTGGTADVYWQACGYIS